MAKWIRRIVLSLVALLLTAVVAARFWDAGRYRDSIQQELQQELRRTVEIKGRVQLQVLPRPGFSLEQVVIHEAPAFGVEPFAYVSELQIGVSVLSLLQGKLQAASIRLMEPSVNLSKPETGGWNAQAFLQDALGPAGRGSALPSIEVSAGRLNFKTGDVKSVFYLADTDLSIEADAEDGQRFGIRVEGEPARTDRAQRGFGRMSGRGMLLLASEGRSEPEIQLGLQVERTAVSEIVTLLAGRTIGFGGFARTQMRLSGPLSRIEVSGRVQLDEFERFSWAFGRQSGWAVDYKGKLDLKGQAFEIASDPAGGSPMSARIRATGLFERPKWAAIVACKGVPLASIRAMAAELGAAVVPKALAVEGKITGAMGISSAGMQGALEIQDAKLVGGAGTEVAFDKGLLIVQPTAFRLTSSTVQTGRGETAVVEAILEAESGAKDLRLQTARMRIGELRKVWSNLGGESVPPVLERCQDGFWSGAIRFQRGREGPGTWSVDGKLLEAKLTAEGVAGIIEVERAGVVVRGGAVRMAIDRASVQETPFAGEIQFDLPGSRTPQVRLSAREWKLAEMEKSLGPVLAQNRSLLARTLGRPQRLPEWLRKRRMDAQWEVGALILGEHRLEKFRAKLRWEGGRMRFREISAEVASGALTGEMDIDLTGRTPLYRGQFRMRDASWKGGHLDLDADAEGTGLGTELVQSLRGQGQFWIRGLDIAPDQEWRSASGSFLYGGPAGVGRVQLHHLEALVGGENYSGQGESGPDGKWSVEMSGGQRPIRLAGRVSGWQIDFSTPR